MGYWSTALWMASRVQVDETATQGSMVLRREEATRFGCPLNWNATAENLGHFARLRSWGAGSVFVSAQQRLLQNPRVSGFFRAQRGNELWKRPTQDPLRDRHCCASSDVMEAAIAVEALHPIGQRSLSLTYPGLPNNHPCLIRPLRITPTYIFCFCHMDALDEVLCTLSIWCKVPRHEYGEMCVPRTSKRKKMKKLRTFCAHPAHRSACSRPVGSK
jgi:hypothetical protein